ncbi:hypothetical protein F2Q70_00026910 [Brassica cretica]|uniref:Uncharacterized protein n=1 Tax=Brassica cretica TaxID=69181 RepID=A0A8S9L5K4_BRACR|nr:hypothetical protein F2Q70_00026910 [Brassica cretica]
MYLYFPSLANLKSNVTIPSSWLQAEWRILVKFPQMQHGILESLWGGASQKARPNMEVSDVAPCSNRKKASFTLNWGISTTYHAVLAFLDDLLACCCPLDSPHYFQMQNGEYRLSFPKCSMVFLNHYGVAPVKKRGMVCCAISSSCRPNMEVSDVAPCSNRKKASFTLNNLESRGSSHHFNCGNPTFGQLTYHYMAVKFKRINSSLTGKRLFVSLSLNPNRAPSLKLAMENPKCTEGKTSICMSEYSMYIT